MLGFKTIVSLIDNRNDIDLPSLSIDAAQHSIYGGQYYSVLLFHKLIFYIVLLYLPTQCLLTQEIPKPRNGWGPHEHPVFSSIKTGMPWCTSKLGDFFMGWLSTKDDQTLWSPRSVSFWPRHISYCRVWPVPTSRKRWPSPPSPSTAATAQFRACRPTAGDSLEASGKVLGVWTCWIHEILELYVVFFTSSPFTFIQVCNSSMAEVLQTKTQKHKCFTTLNKTILVGTYPSKSLRFQSWNFIWVCLKIWSPIPRTIWFFFGNA